METSPKEPRPLGTVAMILGFFVGMQCLGWVLMALFSKPGDWAL